MRLTSIARYFLVLFWGMLPVSAAMAQVDITTWQGSLMHTGLNSHETILTPGGVQAPQSFGLLFTQQTDGSTFGQPLFMSKATLATLPGSFQDLQQHNVVYIATEAGSLYAFDADADLMGSNPNGTNSKPLWHMSLIPAGETPIMSTDTASGDIQGNLAVTTTPVIDPATGTIYIVSTVKTVAAPVTFHQYLYAFDLKTGNLKAPPLLIDATFPGTPQPLNPKDKDQVTAPDGQIPFSALHEHLRGAMTLSKGILYLIYASHSDETPYYGEILGYDVTSFPARLVKTFITTPNGPPANGGSAPGQEGGLWQSGAGPAFDSDGNLYVITGNGSFDQRPDANGNVNQNDWGESVLKLPTDSTQLQIPLLFSDKTSWFTPHDWQQLNSGQGVLAPDRDLGGGGLLLLPDQTQGSHPHIMVGGGKAGVLYVLDRDSLGGFTPDDKPALQEIMEPNGTSFFMTPAYFNGNIYYAPAGGQLEQRQIGFEPSNGNYVSTTAITSTVNAPTKGASVFISSSSDTSNGIVWLANFDLEAYDATNVQNPIFKSTTNVPGPNGGQCQTAKFSVPIAVNGKVYLTCFPNGNNAPTTGYLFVYGLLPLAAGQPAAPTSVTAVANSSTQVTVSWTAGSGPSAARFQINRSTTANGPTTALNPGGDGTTTTFQDKELTPGTTYFYQVVALATGVPNSTPSLTAQATTFSAPTQPGLVAYWNMDDTSQTSTNSTTGAPGSVVDIFDVTGNGHLGEAVGETGSVAGYINGGFFTHGTSSKGRIQVNSTPDMQFAVNQSFTLSAWVELNDLSTPDEQAVIAKSIDQGNPYGIWINKAKQWVARGPGFPATDLVGPTANPNAWTNVAVVQDGTAGTRTLYINGVQVASGPALDASGAGQLWMGAQNSANNALVDGANMNIDEVRLYNIALPPSAVTDVMAPPVIDMVSNQIQGNGTFGVTLYPSLAPLNEPRIGSTSGTYNLAVHFASAVTGITASLGLQGSTQQAVGQVASVTMDSTNTIATIVLDGVQTNQALNLHLANVAPVATAGVVPIPGTADVPFYLLQGDVTGDHVVDKADVRAVTANQTGAVSQASAIYDLNADGIVNSTDVNVVTGLASSTPSLNVQTDASLAQYKNAVAFSTNGNNMAALAFDNDPINTRWESTQLGAATPNEDDQQWIYVDLGAPATIHTISLIWENAAGQNYDLQVSNDPVTAQNPTPTNWTTIKQVIGNSSPGLKTYSGFNVTGRFVRMLGHTRTTTFGYSLFDFQVIGSFFSNSGTGTAPSITSALNENATVGVPFSYQIVATQNPTNFIASGLPAGLNLNSTGLISGTPLAVGTSMVALTASNTSGKGNAVLTINASAAPAPQPPTMLTPKAGAGQVTLNWTASAGAATYSVFRGTTSGGEGATPLKPNLTATSFTDSNVTAGTTYFYFVEAVNSTGPSTPSNEVSAAPTAVVIPPPATPMNLTATAGNSQITLNWTAVSGATSYNVFRGNKAGGENTAVAIQQVQSPATSFVDNNNLTNGTTYFYEVQAVIGGVASGLSNEASATPAAPQSSNGAPVYQIDAGSSTSVSASGVTFSMDEFSNGGNESNAGNVTINTTGVANAAPPAVYATNRGGQFMYTLPGLIPGDSYTVRLHFAENFWAAAMKRQFNVTINGTLVLPNFDIFCAAAVGSGNCTSSTTGGKNVPVVKTYTTNANSSGQIVIAFTNGTADNPQVNGIEVLTNGGAMPAPAAPIGLTATPGKGQVSPFWNPGNGPTGTYNVFRSTVSGGEGSNVAINTTPLTGTHFVDTKVTNLTTYFYTVVATNIAGVSSASSNEATAVPGAPVVGTAVYQIATGTTPTTVAAISPFVDDNFFNGGATSGNGNTIDTSAVVSPAPAAVYDNERSGGTFTYKFLSLTPGAQYTVRLHFAETFFQSVGQRVFNVAINNIPVLQNFDILATAGAANKAVVEQFTATADSAGIITITYTPGPADQPKTSAIEIYQ